GRQPAPGRVAVVCVDAGWTGLVLRGSGGRVRPAQCPRQGQGAHRAVPRLPPELGDGRGLPPFRERAPARDVGEGATRPRDAVKEQISRSVFWMVWSRGTVQVLSFASTILVARLLSPADYGLMALTAIWIYMVSLVA